MQLEDIRLRHLSKFRLPPSTLAESPLECSLIFLYSARTYERGVSFDTFDNPDAPDFSLTLNYKHKGYQSTRRSRTFLCGTDQNDYSDFALEWLIDELVDDGDEIVCLRAVEKDSTIASDAGIEAGKYRKEAEKLFEQVIQKNSQNEKAISLVLELAVGKIQEIIQRMVCFTLSLFFLEVSEIIELTRERSEFTNLPSSSSVRVVAVLVAFKGSSLVPSPSIVYNNHPFPLSWSDRPRSVKRRRRSALPIRLDAATIISWK